MKDTPGDIGVSHGNTTRRDRAAAGRGGRVTTAAVRAANRANAARSTGPRTRAGKVAVSRNALRHGLSLPVLADPALAPEIAALARRIAGEDASEARHAVAVRIAEAQVDVLRVRRLRDQVMAAGFTEDDITARLMRLDRYERRALSRRKSAIKAFDALQGEPAPRRRRDPWVAVAAAAGLRGFWQNKPDAGGALRNRSFGRTKPIESLVGSVPARAPVFSLYFAGGGAPRSSDPPQRIAQRQEEPDPGERRDRQERRPERVGDVGLDGG